MAEINGRITLPNMGVTLEYVSVITARHTFENMQRAVNAPAMTLWVRDNGRCDFIQFTPNGG